MLAQQKEILYDVPVSNHGARCRIILRSKGILGSHIDVQSPAALGGLTSPEFTRLNPQKKMPLLVTEGGYPISESDTISRYIIDKYAAQGPSFTPSRLPLRVLSEQIVRLHDIYLTPIQGCLYKAPGYIFSTFGLNRRAAVAELTRQLQNIEDALVTFDKAFPGIRAGGYLCGDEISYADAALFPSMVFYHYMLPRFFEQEPPGQLLNTWFDDISKSDEAAETVRREIESALRDWEAGGRWGPILEELKASPSPR